METIEKRLTDYKGFEVWKVTDNKGLRTETITYMLNDQDENNLNSFNNLKDLKKWADMQ
jgi:hypothetical protein